MRPVLCGLHNSAWNRGEFKRTQRPSALFLQGIYLSLGNFKQRELSARARAQFVNCPVYDIIPRNDGVLLEPGVNERMEIPYDLFARRSGEKG